MPDLRLRANGRDYGGWETIRVTRGIESIAGSFELEVSDRWAGQTAPWPIAPEDECEILIDGVTVISGYVDSRSLSYGAEDHALSVAGRDRTGVLVDCSAVLGKWEFAGIPLLTLARRITEPFGISVSMDPGVEGLPKPTAEFSIDPGESAFEILDRACRMTGVLPVSDGQGGLVLTRTGSARATAALVEGENILVASAEYDASARYRRYLVMAQQQGTDELSGTSAAAVKGEATDESVRRSARVLLIRPEASATRETARRRAEWEAKIRAARGDAVTVSVQGWTQGDGLLWPVNALVPVRSPFLGVDGEMLVTQVVHSLDDSTGTRTELLLKRPDAFLPEPVIAKGSDSAWKAVLG